MPKHGFRFPPEVIDAVREHVRNAIGRVAPERFSQEANYTAALASQLEGTAYVGEHGSVVFKSTVFDDRGPSSAEHQFSHSLASGFRPLASGVQGMTNVRGLKSEARGLGRY